MDETWVNETSPWIKYPLSNWRALTENRSPVFYKRKSALFHQDDPAPCAYLVSSGRVRVTTFSLSGSEKQLIVAESGCLLSEISCIMGFSHAYSGICIQDTWAYRISQSDLIQAARDDWELNMRIYNSVFRKNIILRNQLLELSFLSALARMARLMLHLNRQYGQKSEDGWHLNVRFTHSDIASMINASRVTVNTIFTWMQQNECLKKCGSQVTILSLEKLEWLADGGVPEHF